MHASAMHIPLVRIGPGTFRQHHLFASRYSARCSLPARLHTCTAAAASRDARTVKRKVSLRFCEICGTGTGLLSCPICQGSGEVATQPGGAGKAFYVGTARCRQCNGIGEVPCPMCAGWERSMKDLQSPKSPDAVGSADEASIVHPPDLTWLDEP